MNNFNIPLAISLIGICISFATIFITYKYNKAQIRHNDDQLLHIKNKIFEDISFDLIKLRIDPYASLMADLVQVSSVKIKGLSDEQLKVKANLLIEIVQKNIFGKIGLIASHETREMILRLRGKCRDYLDGKIEFDTIHMAAMEVHQILRSDLGLFQPGLASSLEKLRTNKIAGTKEQIEEIAMGMKHIIW